LAVDFDQVGFLNSIPVLVSLGIPRRLNSIWRRRSRLARTTFIVIASQGSEASPLRRLLRIAIKWSRFDCRW
jgi:hypothetical protein